MKSNDIKVGDRVTWKPRYRHKNVPETMTGRVISVHGGRKPWAGVARDYLAGSRLEAAGAVDGVPLYRVVCDARAAVGLTWLTTQAGPAIRRKLGSVLGMAVVVEIVVCDRPEAIVAAEVAVSA